MLKKYLLAISLFPFKISCFGIYQRLLTYISLLDLKDPSLLPQMETISLCNSKSYSLHTIQYIHFPTLLINSEHYNNSKYQKSLFWKGYFRPYQIVSNVLTKNALERSNVVLPNSRFSERCYKESISRCSASCVVSLG